MNSYTEIKQRMEMLALEMSDLSRKIADLSTERNKLEDEYIRKLKEMKQVATQQSQNP